VKTRIPTAAISRTLQAVATFGMVAPSSGIEATKTTTIASPPHVAGVSDSFSGLISLSEELETSTAIKLPIAAKWDKAAEKRFLALVDREANDIATTDEIEELERLADLRRRSEIARTGEEVLREYEQHQLIRNLLYSLTRYVKFIENASIESSSTRSRPKAKT
jgi:hypothetical protein